MGDRTAELIGTILLCAAVAYLLWRFTGIVVG